MAASAEAILHAIHVQVYLAIVALIFAEVYPDTSARHGAERGRKCHRVTDVYVSDMGATTIAAQVSEPKPRIRCWRCDGARRLKLARKDRQGTFPALICRNVIVVAWVCFPIISIKIKRNGRSVREVDGLGNNSDSVGEARTRRFERHSPFCLPYHAFRPKFHRRRIENERHSDNDLACVKNDAIPICYGPVIGACKHREQSGSQAERVPNYVDIIALA